MAPIAPRSDELRVILLTGRPGVGKTTVVNRVYDHYSKNGFKIDGLTTREVREAGARTGFMITDLSSGQEGWLAKKDLGTGPRVGS
jgi:nucleoside-triphosphatase